jgi:hypothetical protein
MFHDSVWDFKAGGVYWTDAMCLPLVHLRVAFLARLAQAVKGTLRSGKDQWPLGITGNNGFCGCGALPWPRNGRHKIR